ncbi:MAG: fibronectin type III domain-containing protein, partial [Cyclobacteriaceae bacterium]
MKTSTCVFRKPILMVLLLLFGANLQAQQSSLQSDNSKSGTRGGVLAPIITFVVPATDPTKLSVSWSDPNPTGTVSQYLVERRTSQSLFEVVSNAFSTFYIDDDVTPGILYTYVITAIGTNGQFSPRSNAGSASIPVPLAAPTNLVATANNQTGTVTLNWDDSNANETGFEIDRSVNNGSFTLFRDISLTGSNITITDSQTATGNSYRYRVRAKRNAGRSPYSNIASVNIIETIAAPSQLSATTLSSSGIRINWTDNSTNETKFIIERARVNGPFNFSTEVGANQTTYTDNSLDPNTLYRYRVFAANNTLTSASSNVASSKTFNRPPNAPTDFSATFIPSSVSINFSWTDRSNNETSHQIEFKLDSETQWQPLQLSIPGNATTASISVANIIGDRTFDLRIRAVNSLGASPWSNIDQVYLPPNNPAPIAPTNLTASYVAFNKTVAFSWTDQSPNETGFEIEFKLDTETTWNPLLLTIPADATTASISVTNVLGDRTFDIRIRAVNATGPSQWSNIAQVY